MSARRGRLTADQVDEILRLDSLSDNEQLSDMEDNVEEDVHRDSEIGESSDEDNDEAIVVMNVPDLDVRFSST